MIELSVASVATSINVRTGENGHHSEKNLESRLIAIENQSQLGRIVIAWGFKGGNGGAGGTK
jgi:uncharacterized protein YheU (UPF0270 family)